MVLALISNSVVFRWHSNCNRNLRSWHHAHNPCHNSYDRCSICYCHHRICSVSLVKYLVFDFSASLSFYAKDICAKNANK